MAEGARARLKIPDSHPNQAWHMATGCLVLIGRTFSIDKVTKWVKGGEGARENRIIVTQNQAHKSGCKITCPKIPNPPRRG